MTEGASRKGAAGEEPGGSSRAGRVPGIVPAAGRSRRMGTSKPLLDAGGRSFLQRVVGALGDGGCEPILVVVRDPDGMEAAMARGEGATVIENRDPSQGPISSLRAALRSLGGDVVGCAFCPVDHPRIDAGTVAGLLSVFRESEAVVVVPRHGRGRGHPVFFHHSLFPELLEEGLEEGARTVIRRHEGRIREVEVDDEGVIVDIDTPGEYRRHFPAAFRERFQGR